jgi:hypothetical protein
MPTEVTCTCSALGSQSKILTESTGTAPRTFNSSSLRHELIYETVGTKRPIASSGALTGSGADLTSSVRSGSYLTQGVIAVQASPKELRKWLPRIFGGVISGSNVTVTNTLAPFDVLVYRENGLFHYTDAVVAQAVLRGKTSSGGDEVDFMDFIIQIVGKEELIDITAWPDPEPSVATTADYLPYTFYESSLVLNSLDVEYEAINVTIDNNLDVKFFNKQYPSCVRMTKRSIKLGIQAAFTCDNLATALSMNTTAGTGTFALTTTGMSTSFEFAKLRNTFETPTIPGKASIPQKINLEAFAAAADGINVTVTQDDTP